jgi:AAA15 family ATPase/GTPase
MFKVKNFASFRDETILDMRATSYKQHPNHILETPDDIKLLKTTAIYGANASGKSNFIEAMYFFEKYVFDQFISKSRDGEDLSKDSKIQIDLEKFLLGDEVNDISEFEIIFLYNKRQIQYGFECTNSSVLNEWY